jgi:hypothetical protein
MELTKGKRKLISWRSKKRLNILKTASEHLKKENNNK